MVYYAYYREYLSFQRLCILILQRQKHQIGTGSKQIYGILVDGAWLWEEYLYLLIGKEFHHPMNKGGKGAQRLFEGNNGLIYPDFISENNTNRQIADAKVGYYLYPEAKGADDMKLRMNCGSTYEGNVTPRDDVIIIKHGLRIPTDVAFFVASDKSCT